MTGGIAVRYALRSVLRNRKRTVLSMAGGGIGCAIGLIAVSWIAGAQDMEIRAAAESGTGHISIVPDGWARTREETLRLVEWRAARRSAEAVPGVRGTAPRARASALLAFGNRTAGVELTGVDPDAERKANRVVFKSPIAGRYLRPRDRGVVVVGRALADRLRVGVGDDLMVTAAGTADIRSGMLRICGVVSTGSRELDLALCHVSLADVEALTGLSGAGEIAVLLDDRRLIGPVRAALASRLPRGDAIMSWDEIMPAWAAGVEGDVQTMHILAFIIVVMVALGITSAQLAAVLERQHEFAVLAAIGVGRGRLAGMVLLESVLNGLGGAAVAAIVGLPPAWWLASKGVSMTALMGGDTAMLGVMLDPYLRGDFGPWCVWFTVSVSLGATILAGLYPAWFATRGDPAAALRRV